MEVSSRHAFNTIFPRYSEVLVETKIIGSPDFEAFIRDELPGKV